MCWFIYFAGNEAVANHAKDDGYRLGGDFATCGAITRFARVSTSLRYARNDRGWLGGKRRLLLLEPMAARGRMSGRGPQAQRSGRDEQSKTAKGSSNSSLLFPTGRGRGPGRLRRRRTGEGSASEVDRGGFSVGGGAGWSRGKAERTFFLRRGFFDDLRKIVFSAIYGGVGKAGGNGDICRRGLLNQG